MRCPSCAGETPDAGRFCVNCGAAMSERCTSCAAELVPGKPFCAECGARVEATGAPAAAVAAHLEPTAERRLCSVLFLDLVGFTPLAEHRDAEQVRELLSEYFERAQRIISAYGGTVEKFIGDAVMAVWGAPVANEDDAERAVRTALDLVDAVTSLGREVGLEDLRARAGVVTGEVAITIGRVSEGMVLGDTVNTASRIQSEAEPGTVLVDEGTWRAASGAIAFEDVGSLTLKGKDEPVRAWRAMRVVGQRKGLGRSERLEPPFVGRDEEIRLIKDLLHATAREQRARLVSVTGIPGIGKSRLAWEFLKYVDGLADDVYWHQGRSRTYGEGVAFGALTEMIRMRAGILDDDDAATATAKMRATLGEFIADPDERVWVESRVAHLLGLAEAPPGDRDETFSAWRRFFEGVASKGLTVLVFEDLQWADPGLIDFVESLPDQSRGFPILVITLSRPELTTTRPSWGAGQRNFSSLHLEPLTPGAMRELLEGFVVGLANEATERVLERAEGVPLYAVEMIRMLIDRGTLVDDGAVVRVVGSLDHMEIPETLHALITSRLDSLPGELRSLLQDAGVVGSTFRPETVAVVNGQGEDAVREGLTDLVRRELLFLESDPRSPERGQFTFVQAVIREVAVGMLARRDRSLKHLTVARHFEAFNDDELAGVVAGQYLEAYRSAPDGDGATDLAAHAVLWLMRAARRTLALGSPAEAVTLYQEAITLVGSGSDRAAALEGAADAMIRQSNFDGAIPLLEEAIEIHRTRGDVAAAAMATIPLVRAFSLQRSGHSGVPRAVAMFEELGDDGDLTARGNLAEVIGSQIEAVAGAEEALRWTEVAFSIAERLDDDALFARCLGTRSLVLFNVGRHREAAVLARGMAEIADKSGALREQAAARMGLSLYMLPDDPVAAMALCLECAELARRGGHLGVEMTSLLNRAETAVYMGHVEESRQLLEELAPRAAPAVEMWLKSMLALIGALLGEFDSLEAFDAVGFTPRGDVHSVTTRLNCRSFAALAVGDLETARADASEAVALDPSGINCTQSLFIWFRSALWLRDADGVRGAIEGMDRLRGRAIAAGRSSARAGLAALEGRLNDAAVLYQEAIEQWRELDMPLDLALCELDLVMMLGANHPDATVAKEAADIFAQIKTAPFARRLDAALS